MTEPSGLEYCVRDRDGRIVVAWRPVEELVAALTTLLRRSERYGYLVGAGSPVVPFETTEYAPAARAVNTLLGLGPAPDADR